VVGNTILLLIASIIVAIFVGVLCNIRQVSLLAALRCVAFPTCLLPVWVVVLPSTVTATAQIVAASTGCAGDAVCVLVGLLIVAGPLAGLVVFAFWAPIHAVPAPRPRPPQLLSKATVELILRPTWRWELDDHPGHICSEHKIQHCFIILREYKSLPYAAFDAAILFTLGGLVAVSGHGSHSQCTAATASVTALYVTQFIVCVLCRPYTSLFGLFYTCFTLLFTMLSALLQLSMFTMVGSSDTAYLLLQLSQGASVCDVVVLGASVVKSIIDLSELAVAVRTMTRRDHQPTLVDLSTTVGDEGIDEENEEMICLLSALGEASETKPDSPQLCKADDNDDIELVEGAFWDAKGNAITFQHCGDLGDVMNHDNDDGPASFAHIPYLLLDTTTQHA
jgi:hypothetical protein